MIKSVKRATLATLKQLGVFRLVSESEWRRQRLTILCYHGVSLDDEHEWNPIYYMSAACLESRLRMLRDGGYNVLALGAAVDALSRGTLPPRSVVLTFDDGMYDFRVNAAPLLQRYGFPATVYLTTYYSDYQRPIFDVFCSYVLWKGRRSGADLRSVASFLPRLDLGTLGGRTTARRLLGEYAEREQLSAADKDALGESLARHLGLDFNDLLARRILHVMSNEDVSALAEQGIDFQLHTHRHRVPGERTAFLREITDNRNRIAALGGRGIAHFCYPSGVHEPQFLPWLTEAGVLTATTCESGIATRETARLLLPRIIDGMHLSPVEVEAWLTGVAAFVPGRPTWLGETASHAEDSPEP